MSHNAFKDKYQAAFHTMLDAIVFVNPTTFEVEDVNAQVTQLTGYSAEELMKEGLKLLDSNSKVRQLLERTLQDKKQHVLEFDVLTKKKESLAVSMRVDFIEMEHHRHLILVFQDITKIRKMEEAIQKTVDQKTQDLQLALETLQKSNQLKSDFVAMVSHEIRNPLTVLKSTMVLINNSKLGAKKREEVFQIMVRHIDQMIDISNDLLDVSKIEAGVMQYHLEKLSLCKLLCSMAHHYHSFEEQCGIKLLVECPKDYFIYADELKTKQILDNLISNAFKATPKGGKIILSARSLENSFMEISVSDTGHGIEKDNLQHLFKRFVRLKGPWAHIKGTGLGLSIVKSLVEAQGGKIWAESEIGKGATFRFTLPATAVPVVVLVDEDVEFSEKVSKLLEEEGYRVKQCHSAFRGIEECQEMKPHVVVLDLKLSDLSGEKVVDRLKEMPLMKDLPFVFLISQEVEKPDEKVKDIPVVYKSKWEYELLSILKKQLRMQVQREIKPGGVYGKKDIIS
ncbi:MAG: response regulator [Deltaproteobacteria bacterium]|nr:response regulator [Deltaproteobacteria bacterium]